ncbi:MAG TPA: zf-HC2 domain-containing protein [Actinomycetales bacterium]|nr:zf-HC2 domain-containing protein [Actinomycetales bacterium]
MSHQHRCNRPEFAHDDAAFVLGALSDDERQAYTDHLRECPACRRSVTEFAPLPALLSRVPIDVVRSLDDGADHVGDADADNQNVDDDTHVDLLPSLLDRVAREERRQRRARRSWFAVGAGIAAAAAAAVTFAVLPGGPFFSAGDSNGSAAPAPSVSTQQAADRTATLTALQPTAMKVDVALTSVAWGTRVRITCTYPDTRYGAAPSSSYALVVRTAGGAEQQVASWGSVPGRQVTVDGATATPLTAIRTLEVRDASGAAVMRTQL